RGFEAGSIEAALLSENRTRCVPPLPDAEVRGIAASVTRYAPADEPGAPHLTDYGNARRLVAAHGADLRYVPVWNKWLAWDGMRWGPSPTLAGYRDGDAL